jgi:hypothetical protein
MSRIKVVRSLTVLDSIPSLGPSGPACSGPLAVCSEVEIDPTTAISNASPVVGTAGYIFPCGYGSSGGLALLSLPGRDDRTLLAEAACLNVKALFFSMNHGFVFVAVPTEHGGTMVMNLDFRASKTKISPEIQVDEIELSEWYLDENTRDFLSSCILSAVSMVTC